MPRQGEVEGRQGEDKARGSLEVVRSSDSTGGALVEFRARYEPHGVPPPPHYHPIQAEHFQVVSGRLTAIVGGKRFALEKGDRLDVDRGTVHKMWNEGDVEAVVSWEVRPALRTQDFMTAMWASRGLLKQLLLIRRFRKEYRLASPPAVIQDLLFLLLAPWAYRGG